jgi:hypothetical protein
MGLGGASFIRMGMRLGVSASVSMIRTVHPFLSLEAYGAFGAELRLQASMGSERDAQAPVDRGQLDSGSRAPPAPMLSRPPTGKRPGGPAESARWHSGWHSSGTPRPSVPGVAMPPAGPRRVRRHGPTQRRGRPGRATLLLRGTPFI